MNDEHVGWVREDLTVGDEIVVQIVEADDADRPRTRYASDAEVVEQAEREYYEMLEAKYEPE